MSLSEEQRARSRENWDSPPPEILRAQAGWLAPARARLLRRVQIARRRRVLDLGCGSGAVSGELARRCGGQVVALDCSLAALRGGGPDFAGAWRVCADAGRLPLADRTFDLVFCQFVLMWLDAAAVLREVRRVLAEGGVLVAVEPDYGGMIEHPPELASGAIWRAALARAGADPLIGRKLPAVLAEAGFQCRVDLLERIEPPSAQRLELLRGLPLSDEEQRAVGQIAAAEEACAPAARVVHLPVMLVTAWCE